MSARPGPPAWSVLAVFRTVPRALKAFWRELRAWRRIYFTSFGLAFTLGCVLVGLAAMNTGNNLLYLLMGAMVGFICVSSWLSEQTIRDVRVERGASFAVTVRQDLRLAYQMTNQKRFLPSLAIEVREAGLPNSAFVAHLPGRGSATARSTNAFVRRGIYRLGTVTLSTSFPFGLFRKERDVQIPGEVVVYPRTDRSIRPPMSGAGREARSGAAARGALGTRGEYRSLHGYRPGDDPKDIHWRSSARSREPVVRDYERDGSQTRWIVLETRAEPGEAVEVAVEVAAALLAHAHDERRAFALVAGDAILEPGEGRAHLERALDVLARVDFDPGAAAPRPPVPPSACVLVGVTPARGFGGVYAVGHDARLETTPPGGSTSRAPAARTSAA